MATSYILLLTLGRAARNNRIRFAPPIAHTLGTHIQVVSWGRTVCNTQMNI